MLLGQFKTSVLSGKNSFQNMEVNSFLGLFFRFPVYFFIYGVYGIADIFLSVVQVVFCHGARGCFGSDVEWSQQRN